MILLFQKIQVFLVNLGGVELCEQLELFFSLILDLMLSQQLRKK